MADCCCRWRPLAFSDDLFPAKNALGLEDVQPLGRTFYGGAEGATTTRGELHNFTWIDSPPYDIRLEVSTGLIYSITLLSVIPLLYRKKPPSEPTNADAETPTDAGP